MTETNDRALLPPLRPQRDGLVQIDRGEIVGQHLAVAGVAADHALAGKLGQRIAEMVLRLQRRRALHQSVGTRPR